MDSSTPLLRLRWLGHPLVEVDDQPIELETRKALGLLAYLSVERESRPREFLATLFWPDFDPERALKNLRQIVWSLNKTLPAGTLAINRDYIGLEVSSKNWVDVSEFRALLSVPNDHEQPEPELNPTNLENLARALNLYRGDFLAGFNLPDSPEFDDWQFFLRESLRQEAGKALEQLAQTYLLLEDWDQAIIYARRWVALDGLHEPAQRLLMSLYARSGQRRAALRQYQEFTRLLLEELDQAPEVETSDLHERIRAGKLEGGKSTQDIDSQKAARVSKISSAERPPPASLPSPPTPFIGRSVELAEISQLIDDPDCRLLTITGLGGVGKTRLALQAAAGLAPRFAHGASFIPLAPLSSPELIIPTLANHLKFTFYGQEDNKAQLLNYLEGKQIFLVLDNFEHLLTGADLLVEILTAASGVKILVTSRERLNLSMEWVMPLSGMSYPEFEEAPDFEDSPAVQLFLATAKRARINFTLREADKPALVHICHLVNGLPLGIELAASWVRALTLDEIAVEIENNLDFLATSLQDIPERHRSIRAVFEHSLMLLSAEEQRVFRQLSVFQGGFTRQAAQAVTGTSIQVLTSLVDRSLLVMSPDGRYHFHELLRQYAQEKLALEPNERNSVFQDHSLYYLDYLARKNDDLHRQRQKEAISEITAELENIRSAWTWGVSRGQREAVFRAAPSLDYFYDNSSRPWEGVELFGIAIEAFEPKGSAEVNPDREAWLQYGYLLAHYSYLSSRANRVHDFPRLVQKAISIFERWEDPYGQAIMTMQESMHAFREEYPRLEKQLRKSLEVFESVGDRLYSSSCLQALGDIYRGLGDPDAARAAYLESLEINRVEGFLAGETRALNALGNLAEYVTNFAEAKQYYHHALKVARETGERWMTSLNLDNLGYVCRLLGEFEDAETYHQESLEISREIGDQLGIAGSLDNLGLVAFNRGDAQAASRLIEDGLKIRRQIGRKWDIAVSLENLAGVYLVQNRLDEAEQLLEEALPIRQWQGYADGLSHCLSRLGWIYIKRGDTTQAVSYFQKAIDQAHSIRARSYSLSGLVGIAYGLMKSGYARQAYTWLWVAMAQPNLSPEDRQLASEAITELESQSEVEMLAQWRQESQSLSQEEVILAALNFVWDREI